MIVLESISFKGCTSASGTAGTEASESRCLAGFPSGGRSHIEAYASDNQKKRLIES